MGPRCRECGGYDWNGEGRCGACATFPTLGYLVGDWIEANCAIPDGEHAGEPYLLTDEMWRFLLRHYRVNPAAFRDERSGLWRGVFFFDRGSQLCRPQKWGKGPFSSAITCAEAAPDGPVLLDGWDADGQPVGRPRPTPWIQVAATSEDQTDNVWSSIVPMIERGALAADIPDTGLTRILLPDGGKIEPVTSSAGSRLGQRIGFAVQDQTESMTDHNGGRRLVDTMRRNLAGMGGRWLETCNAWDPRESSVAQYTAEHERDGVHHDDVDPGAGSIRNKTDRRRMLRKVYGGSWWVDLDRVESEIVALLPRDPAQAERWYLNRKQAGEDAAFDVHRWAELAAAHDVPAGALVVVGVDGARFRDALAIVATEVETGYQWPLIIRERPPGAGPAYEHDADAIDGVMVDAFARFDVWRAYVDPQHISHLLERWQGRWGDKRVVPWWTNRPKPIAWAVRNYSEAVAAGDVTHDGDGDLARHVANARRQKLTVRDDKGREMHTIAKDFPESPRKMDAAMAAVLSWEARGDAIADGALEGGGEYFMTFTAEELAETGDARVIGGEVVTTIEADANAA
jgi:hypothetical protein